MSKDTIYREDAIGACAYETLECYEARKTIRALPSADRPQGEWIMHIDDLFPCESTQECSVCHVEQLINGNDNNFCPHCGADMRPKLQGTHFDSIIIDECAMRGADDE